MLYLRRLASLDRDLDTLIWAVGSAKTNQRAVIRRPAQPNILLRERHPVVREARFDKPFGAPIRCLDEIQRNLMRPLRKPRRNHEGDKSIVTARRGYGIEHDGAIGFRAPGEHQR